MIHKLLVAALCAVVLLSACGRGSEPEPVSAVEEASAVSGVHLEALDRSTRPQDDFYQFVNGGWLDTTEIPEIYPGYTVYHEVSERVQDALRDIVEAVAADPGEPGSEAQKVGDLYSSWMDIEAINAAGLAPLRGELDEIAGIDSLRSLAATMASLYRRGVMVPYGLYIYADMLDSSAYTVYFNQSGITMPNRDYYLDLDNPNFVKAREGLRPYIRALLERAGRSPEAAASAANAIYALEEAIATAQWDSVSNRDPDKLYNPYPVSGLSSLGAAHDWPATLAGLGLEGHEQVIVYQPSYFEALDGLLADVPLATWRDYLAFRLLDARALHLDDETAAIRFDYRFRTLYGQEQQKPRWKLGVDNVNTLLGEAVGKLYVARQFPPESKAKMQEMVANIIATFDDTLDELDWMTEATRARAKEKLAKFTPKIGYPDEWRDYSTLEIVAGDHYGNLLRAIEWEHRRDVAKIGRPIDRIEWNMTPQTVNAYYSPTQNEIVFPAARLQPPLFQPDADDAINYGSAGGVIGHEISHGFDDKGSKFDGDGNLANWWTDEDRAAFEGLTRVLVDQFAEFEPVEGMHINGELTLGENIGDLSGVAMAYRAYIRSLGGEEPPVIDGFTGAQRFFIGYAMSRKGKYRPEADVNLLSRSSHSPLKYRVIGPYRNIDAFHEAFGTREGDGMWLPPEERVRIW
jgi:predicted metalloendopeptidase